MKRLIPIALFFCVTIPFFGQVPSNDLCSNAISQTLTNSSVYDTFDLDMATYSTLPNNCTSNGDVWFRIKMPTSGAVRLKSEKTKGSFNPLIQIYEGSCASIVKYDCDGTCDQKNAIACGYESLLLRDTALIGDSIYIRIYNQYNHQSPDSFRVCFEEIATADLPANDKCANAIKSALTTSPLYDTLKLLNTTASNNIPSGSCSQNNEDVWFRIKIPASGAVRLKSEKTNGLFNPRIQVYEGGCGSLTKYECDGTCDQNNGTACGYSNLLVKDTSLIGDSVYVRIYNQYAHNEPDSFRYCFQEILGSDLPINDICEDAKKLSITTELVYDTASMLQSTIIKSPPSGTCGTTNEDVWYRFKVPSNGSFRAEANKIKGSFNPYIQVFTGSCGSLEAYTCDSTCRAISTNSCSSNNFIRDTALAGDSVYLRVYNQYGHNLVDSFKLGLCAIPDASLPTNNSCYTAKIANVSSGGCVVDSISISNLSQTVSNECGYKGYYGEAWVKFEMPASDDVYIETSDIGYGHSLSVTAFEGSCGSLTKISCTATPNYPFLSIRNLGLAGDTIYLAIQNESTGSIEEDSIGLCIKDTVQATIRSDTGSFEVTSSCPVISGNQWIDFVDSTNALAFSLNAKGHYLGRVCWGVRVQDSTFSIETATDSVGNNAFVFPRRFYISPSANSSADVRLYVKKREVHWFRDSISNNGHAVGTSLQNFWNDSLKITKTDGSGFVHSGASPISISPTVTELNDSVLQLEFNVSSFSSFTPMFSPGNPGTPLPVELINFWGVWAANDVVLDWETASELNNSHFEVLRSFDRREFERVGRVNGNGTTNETQHYMFIDPNVAKSAYYKLRQVDFDGKSELSKEIVLTKETPRVSVSPNPFENHFTIYTSNRKVERYELIDIYGRVVKEEVVNKENTTVHFNKDIAHGVYTLRLIVDGKAIDKKLLRK